MKTFVIAAALAAGIALVGAADAGQHVAPPTVTTQPVSGDGTLSSARKSHDGNQFVECKLIAIDDGTEDLVCSAQDAHRGFSLCTMRLTDPRQRLAMMAVNSVSRIRFDGYLTGSLCSDITIFNGSAYLDPAGN